MLENRPFTILCDNQAVIKSITKSSSEKFFARVLRQLQFISQYSTDCEYIRSEYNSLADALARTVLVLIQELPKPIDFDAIADAQKIDPETKSLSNAITSLQLKLLPVINSYKKTLCEISQNVLHVILPLSFGRKASDMIHSLNNAGIKSTFYMIKQKFFWPNIYKDVKNWVNECNNCQRVKVKSHTQTPVARFPKPTQAFEELNIDLIGPLPLSRGHRYIFTITDRYIKGNFAFAVPDTKNDTLATYFLIHYVSLFGVPRVIITDNASYFTSYNWNKFMILLNAKHKFIMPYHCQANEMVERFNRFLRTALRCYDNKEKWFDHLGQWFLNWVQPNPRGLVRL